MPKSIQEMEAEIQVLNTRITRLNHALHCFKEALYYYGDLKAEWDGGTRARRAFINANHPQYKPIKSMIAQIFKEGGVAWLSWNEGMEGFEDYINGNDIDNTSFGDG